MSEVNNQLKEALLEALEELFNAEDEVHAHSLVKLISDIRADLNIIMLTDKYATAHIWHKLRQNISNIQTIMSTTATFVQCVDDIDGAITKFVSSFVPFTDRTTVVDDETIIKAASHDELKQVLLTNYWLFFLVYAATNLRIVNGFLNSILPNVKVKQRAS